MSRNKKIRLFGLVFVLMFGITTMLAGCSNTEYEEPSVESLQNILTQTTQASDYFVNKTVSVTIDGGKSGSKQNKDYWVIKTTSENSSVTPKIEDRVYFWQDSWRYELVDEYAVGTNRGVELWWSNMYQTKEEANAKDESAKKKIAVSREFVTANRLEGNKVVADNENSYQKAASAQMQREELFGDFLAAYRIDAILKPFIDVLADGNNFKMISITRKGNLDYYTFTVNESYTTETAEDGDELHELQLSALGQIEIIVLNTEDYQRISSITNTADDNDSKYTYEMFFSYAAPPIASVNCAEEYVASINDPGQNQTDMTTTYVIIGLAVGLGVPLISLLIWFIVSKFRMFKNFDPETMDMEEYIRKYKCEKKGIAYEPIQKSEEEALRENDATQTVDSVDVAEQTDEEEKD